MDKDKQRTSIYPEATRGVLANQQVHKTYSSGPINKVRDYSPSTLIAMTLFAALVIGALAIGSYIFIFQKVHKVDSSVASFKIAKRFSELKTSQTLSELEGITDNAIKFCAKGEAPTITITHEYSQPNQPRHIDTTVIDTGNIKDLEPILEQIENKSNGARINTLAIGC